MGSITNLREMFNLREAALVERVLAALDERSSGTAAVGAFQVRRALDRIAALWRAIDMFPATRTSQQLGSRCRDLSTLMDVFAEVEPYGLEAVLPTRASLARANGMAKLNLSRMLRHVIDDHLTRVPGAAGLVEAVTEAERSAVTTLIAEDVLRAIASDMEQAPRIQSRATALLAELWDTLATSALADFAPLLDSAWSAKARVRISHTTPKGVTELFQLLRDGCDPAFVKEFSRECAPPEQHEAFEEFVFNATHEELREMRRAMDAHGRGAIGTKDVGRILRVGLERLHTTTGTPRDMFFTYREREMWAAQRRRLARPGPKRTAEEYVMVFAMEGVGHRLVQRATRRPATVPRGARASAPVSVQGQSGASPLQACALRPVTDCPTRPRSGAATSPPPRRSSTGSTRRDSSRRTNAPRCGACCSRSSRRPPRPDPPACGDQLEAGAALGVRASWGRAGAGG